MSKMSTRLTEFDLFLFLENLKFGAIQDDTQKSRFNSVLPAGGFIVFPGWGEVGIGLWKVAKMVPTEKCGVQRKNTKSSKSI